MNEKFTFSEEKQCQAVDKQLLSKKALSHIQVSR